MTLKQVDELRLVAEAVCQHMQRDEFLRTRTDELKNAEQIHRNLRDRRYTVAVIAAMKAGKSTLFNAFLGRDILPNENAACTTATTSVKHALAPADYVIKHLVDGGKDFIRATEGSSLEQNFHAEVRRSRQDNGLAAVREYYTETPIVAIESSPYPELLQQFELIDTPGPNEASNGEFDVSQLREIAYEQLRHADAIVFLLDYQSYKSDTNAQLIQDIFRERQNLEQDADKVFFVLNKIDAMTAKDGTVEETLENVRKLIRAHAPIIKEPRVLAVSAKQGFLARAVMRQTATPDHVAETRRAFGAKYTVQREVEGELVEVMSPPEKFAPALLQESRLLDVEQQIIGRVFEQASSKLVQNGREGLHRVLTNLENETDNQLGALSKGLALVELEVKEAKETLEHLRAEDQQIKAIPAVHIRAFRSSLESLMAGLPGKLQRVVDTEIPRVVIESESESQLIELRDRTQRGLTNAVTVELQVLNDQVLRLYYEAQNQINQELTHAFDALSESASRQIAFRPQSFFLDPFAPDAAGSSSRGDIEASHEGGEADPSFGESAGSVAAGATAGAAAGMALGTVVPILGNVVGAAIGGLVGAIAGFFGRKKRVEPQQTVYRIDLTPLKQEWGNRTHEYVQACTSQFEAASKSLIEKYDAYLEKQLDRYLAQLFEQLDQLLDRHRESQGQLEERLLELQGTRDKIQGLRDGFNRAIEATALVGKAPEDKATSSLFV